MKKLTIKPIGFEKHIVLLHGVEIGRIALTGTGIHKGAAYGTYYTFKPVPGVPVPPLGTAGTTPKLKHLRAKILKHIGL